MANEEMANEEMANEEMGKKTMTATIKIKGCKKAKKKILEIQKAIEELNSSLERTVELKKKIL